MNARPHTIVGAIVSRDATVQTRSIDGHAKWTHISLAPEHPRLELRYERNPIGQIGQVERLERSQADVVWCVATLWPGAADTLDLGVPRWFAGSGNTLSVDKIRSSKAGPITDQFIT